MRSKTRFELYRWVYFVLLWLITMAVCIALIELVAGPAFEWLVYDVSYALPSWDHAKRWALGVLFIGFFAGTLSWYAEKRSCGR